MFIIKRKQQKKMILITAPHSYCSSKLLYRHCDRIAYEMATLLHDKIKPHAPVELVLAEDFRYNMDFNRPISEKSPFQQRINNIIKENKVVFCLDIHSFPKFKIDNNDVYILRHDYNSPLVDEFILYLQNKIKIKEYKGESQKETTDHIYVNYILDKMVDNKIPALLFEFYEYATKSRKEELVEIFASFWIDYFKKKK